ncbi:unannotated protein [freshwater metagenome]|uniref:Unannotated protein n=1 Tax=freshwater metagenome TaxID=449393 RepID=A0A6J7CZJ1_9ZZZZ
MAFVHAIEYTNGDDTAVREAPFDLGLPDNSRHAGSTGRATTTDAFSPEPLRS